MNGNEYDWVYMYNKRESDLIKMRYDNLNPLDETPREQLKQVWIWAEAPDFARSADFTITKDKIYLVDQFISLSYRVKSDSIYSKYPEQLFEVRQSFKIENDTLTISKDIYLVPDSLNSKINLDSVDDLLGAKYILFEHYERALRKKYKTAAAYYEAYE